MANIALYPGGYKPPHIGHYEAAKEALEQADKVIVFVGPKEREGITQNMSIALWKLYTEKDNIEIRPAGVSPVKDVYDFVELEAEDGDTLSFIKGEKDSEDPRFARIPTYAEKFGKKININFINISDKTDRKGYPVSGTWMRGYIRKNNFQDFRTGLPKHLTAEQENEAWAIVIGYTDYSSPKGGTQSTNLGEDFYDPRNKYYDFAKSNVPGPKKDIPRTKNQIHNRQKNPHAHMSEMAGTMTNQEKAKHYKNLKRLKKDLKKQGDQYMEVPSYLKGTLRRKLYETKDKLILNLYEQGNPNNHSTSTALINNNIIPLETMNTPEEQMTGMMGRDSLEGGMLFPYDRVQRRDFHMKNCKIPLDIIFIKQGKINNIHHNCPPHRCKDIKCICPKYSGMADNVLELPGGYCKKHNVNRGDEINLNINQQDNKIKYTLKEADPKKGTGKKPKGSGRRLYTDENPKDTVKVKFSTRQDIVDTLNKKSFKSKSHARKSQIINLIHQRVRAALSRTKDPQKKKSLKSAFEYIKKRKEASKKKTQRMKKEGTFTKSWWKEVINEILLTEGGAAGHMAHPFNLPNVNSGKDLKDIFEKAASSLQTNPGSVKIDGVNSSIRLVDLEGEKQFVMDRGSKKPLDIKGITKADLEDRFKPGHGMIKVGGEVLDMFNEALPSLEADLKKLGAWEDPDILFNMEYVSGKTNVQDYGSNFIAIHGLNKVETKEVQGKRKMLTKRSSSEISYDKAALQSLLDNLAPIAKKNDFEVYGSVPTEVKGKPNFKTALNTQYTIKSNEGDKTQSLETWLNELNNIPEEDFIFMSGKKVGAVSKAVYIALLKGENIDELFESEEDKQKAIEGFTTYLATEKLGDEILKVLDSPMGSVENHEGVVIRDEKIANVPFKITGKFILGGMVSDF